MSTLAVIRFKAYVTLTLETLSIAIGTEPGPSNRKLFLPMLPLTRTLLPLLTVQPPALTNPYLLPLKGPP